MNKQSRLSCVDYFWKSLVLETAYNYKLFPWIYHLGTYFNIKHEWTVFWVVSGKAILIGNKICADVTKLIPKIYTLKILIFFGI